MAWASNAAEGVFSHGVPRGSVVEGHQLQTGSLDLSDGHDAPDKAGADEFQAEDKLSKNPPFVSKGHQPEETSGRSKVADTNISSVRAPAARDVSGGASEEALADQEAGGAPTAGHKTAAAAATEEAVADQQAGADGASAAAATDEAVADDQAGGVDLVTGGTEAASGVMAPSPRADKKTAAGTFVGASPRSPPFGAATQAAANGGCLEQRELMSVNCQACLKPVKWYMS